MSQLTDGGYWPGNVVPGEVCSFHSKLGLFWNAKLCCFHILARPLTGWVLFFEDQRYRVCKVSKKGKQWGQIFETGFSKAVLHSETWHYAGGFQAVDNNLKCKPQHPVPLCLACMDTFWCFHSRADNLSLYFLLVPDNYALSLSPWGA